MDQDKARNGDLSEEMSTIEIGLHKSEDFIRNIVEGSNDAIIAKDLKGIIRSWNKGAEKIFGYKSQEMIGGDMLCLFPGDLLYEEEVFLKTIARGEALEHFQTRRIHKDGRILQVSVTLSPIRNVHGEIIGISTIARAISDQFELHESLRLAKNIIENSNDAIIAKSLNGVITSWNKGAEESLVMQRKKWSVEICFVYFH